MDDPYLDERFLYMSFPPPNNGPHVPTGRPSGPPAAIYVRPSQTPPSPTGQRPRKRWGVRVGFVAALLLVVGGAGLGLRAHYLPAGYVPPGLLVDGERVPDGVDAPRLRSMVEAHAAALSARKVELTVPGADKPVLTSTLGELGLRVDIDETIAVATRIGKGGDPWSRAQTTREARAGKIDVPLRVRIDRDVTTPILDSLKETNDTEAVSARLDLDKHATIPEKDGRYIDQDATIGRLEAFARERKNDAEPSRIELPFATFAPRISAAYLKNLDISTVMAEYETFFSRGGEQKRRGKNIDNASQKLDGLVISPGEMISFNVVVGERSESNGFQKSWEIFKGEMVEGVGGGTCQVASTFHAATFFGGFDVLERLPHSRPSAYIPMGLDSTVVYPGVDLKVRNPHPFPVVVHAKTDGNKLRVELLGKMRPVEVSFGRELVSTIPFKRKIVEEPSLSGKKVLVKQHGIKGYRIKRSRLLKYPDGTSKKEDATDFYPPTTEIYHVPVGFDVALLPALPGGEGEDSDLGGNPSATPPSARAPSTATPQSGSTATASADPPKPGDGIDFVDAPGAHAPTSAQRDPAKTMWLKR